MVGLNRAGGDRVLSGRREVVDLDSRCSIIGCCPGLEGHTGGTQAVSLWNDKPGPAGHPFCLWVAE